MTRNTHVQTHSASTPYFGVTHSLSLCALQTCICGSQLTSCILYEVAGNCYSLANTRTWTSSRPEREREKLSSKNLTNSLRKVWGWVCVCEIAGTTNWNSENCESKWNGQIVFSMAFVYSFSYFLSHTHTLSLFLSLCVCRGAFIFLDTNVLCTECTCLLFPFAFRALHLSRFS